MRAQVDVLPQDTALFNDSIGNDIAYARPGSTLRDVEAAARAAQLHDFIASLPQRYDSQVGERGVMLSGGAGRIVERGTHAGLLAQDGLYARLWRLQQRDARPGRT